MIIHYYQQFFTGPSAPGTLTPRKLMRRLAVAGNQVHVVATEISNSRLTQTHSKFLETL